jgi:hypothetical protein
VLPQAQTTQLLLVVEVAEVRPDQEEHLVGILLLPVRQLQKALLEQEQILSKHMVEEEAVLSYLLPVATVLMVGLVEEVVLLGHQPLVLPVLAIPLLHPHHREAMEGQGR